MTNCYKGVIIIVLNIGVLGLILITQNNLFYISNILAYKSYPIF